jgi:predicted ATPase/DNA-binding CsgD family transcriptional regulator
VRAGPPAPLTTFVGRRRELQTVRRYLASTRFLTLVGPGGCGKTRIAIELARMTAKADVAWVNLAPLRRGQDVQHEVARGLGIAEPDRMPEILAERDNRTLLLLDNCEHVLDAAADAAVRFLRASSRTRLLATSREPLDVEGELVWRVPSLSLPDPLFAGDPARCFRSDAVKLFVERAELAQPGFVLDRATCPHVVALCRAVDGIPLAIELAAARLRHASVAELAGRLDDLLSLLVGTRRAGDPRHRALRAALDWSHDLLDPRERAAFRRLAVFAGGFQIAAAEAVCDDLMDTAEALDLVSSLVDKSLVVPPAEGERYRLLEPIREYALDRLRANDEEEAATERCATYLVELVSAELPDPMGMGSGPGLSRIAQELTNVRAILPWLIRHRSADAVGVLARFAQNHVGLTPTHVSVVSDWLAQALDAYPTRDATRVEGLLGQLQVLTQFEGKHALVRRLADEALAIAIELGDRTLEARALSRSAFVALWEDPSRAMREYDAAVPTLREGHLGALALALAGRAVIRQRAGDRAGALDDIAEGLRAWDRHAGATSVMRINTLQAAADVAFQAGDFVRAEERLGEVIDAACRADSASGPVVVALIGPFDFLAHLAALRGDSERALLLTGCAERLRDETGIWPRPWFSLAERQWLTDLEAQLGQRARTARADGRRLTVAQAVSYALTNERPGSLSARELSVTALVSEGLTDKEIAARLGISERTAESHVLRIREKLGFQSRAQIGRWAADHAPGIR